MLLSSVPAKTLRDRTPLALGVGVGLALFSVVMVAMASSLEDEAAGVLDDMPEALTNMMGGGGGNYVITELFGLIAPIAILVVAISGGIHAFAREERDRTADLLLTQPVTRRQVVLAKSAVLVADLLLACTIFGIGAMAAAAAIDIEGFGPGDALAATVHLLFLGLAFGMIALAAGNATGSTSAGTGIAAGLAVVSNLLAGVLPLVEGLEGLVRISPWYYFNGNDPLAAGIAPGHLVVLAGIALVAFAVAVVAVDRRDVGGRLSGTRFRLPEVGMMVRPRVASVFSKSLTERVTLIVITGGSLAVMAVGISAMYDGIKGTLADFNELLSGGLGDLIGSSDIATPAGWIQAEMLSIVVPLALIAVGVVMGVNAIAGEDARRTLGLVVVTPVTRTRVVLEKAAAMVVAVVTTAVACWLGLVAGSAIGGLGLGSGELAASVVHLALLGVFFGGFGLAVGAATSSSTATRVTIVAALGAYLGDWLLGLNDSLADWAALSPWHYATSADPLLNGVDPVHLAVLAALSAIAVLVAIRLFERREMSA